MLSHTNDSGVNKVIARYSDNSDNSVYNKTDDLTTVYASFEGSHKFTRGRRWNTCWRSMTTTTAQIKVITVRTTAQLYARCTSGTTFTPRLEAGYQRVDYNNGGDNSGWKLTLSQNMSIAMGPEFRPMLRFYVTGGKVDNDRTARVNGTKDETTDDFNLGAMWEAWF